MATAVMDTRVGRTFKAFQYRDFRLMWVGACASSIGTWMQIVAQSWLIYRINQRAAETAWSVPLDSHAFLSGGR